MTIPSNLAGPFDVKVEDLIRITSVDAVELFRQLLVIEATRASVPITAVNVPADIYVSDGGIDAEVVAIGAAVLPAGLITEGLTYYQIKTGAFSAANSSEVRALLVQPKHKALANLTREHLQPRVRSCFEKGGTFVTVLFGTDLVGPADEHGVTQIRAAITTIDPAFANAKVRVIRANQLCAAVKLLAPGIALRLNSLGADSGSSFNDLQFLGECCGLEVDGYRQTPELDRSTVQITQMADDILGLRHIRVLGDAGAGKTHLIYRALNSSKLKGCVLYCRDAEQLYYNGPLDRLSQMSESTTIILVAEECDLAMADNLMATFKQRATKMLLITAHSAREPSNAHVDAEVIDVPRLSQPVLTEIFKSYGIPSDSADWLATLCEGSPQAAHKLGKYVQRHPEEQPSQQLSHLDAFWNRFVCSPDAVESERGQEKLVVMRTLALFRQVAWSTADGAIAQAGVLQALQKLDPNFSKLKLHGTVSNLLERRVLQGRRTLIISPKLLHVAMWKSWFNEYANAVDVIELRLGLPERMQGHFDAMLNYAQESKSASALAERLLGPGGPFAELASFASAGAANLFFAVAQANPKAALHRFARALKLETVEDRKALSREARRTAVHRLEQLAVPADTFFEAADCLLLLAEAENESWSNNATGVFISLFTLGYGVLAASELSPVQKIDYLRGLLRSDIAARRELAVRALSESLSPFLSRTSIEETIGLRRLPNRWMPATYGELFEAYGAHVALLEEASETLPHGEAERAARGILSHIRNLILIEPLAERIITFVRRVALKPGLQNECVAALVATLHYEGKALPVGVSQALLTLRTELTESSFSSKLRRHAGMKLLEDHFNDDGEYSDAAKPQLIELVSEVLQTPGLLETDLAWLVTEEAKNGYEFGQLLGQADANLKLWSRIYDSWIDAGASRSDFFIGGYLSSVHAVDVARWESLLDPIFEDPELRSILVAVVWRSGMSDSVANRLLSIVRRGELDPREFRRFVYGGVLARIPIEVVVGVLDLLLAGDDVHAADAALDILESRLRSCSSDTNLLARHLEQALNTPVLVGGSAEATAPNDMLLYRWNQAAIRLLEFDQIAATHLAARCIDHFGNAGSVTAAYFGEPLKFLEAAARARPAEVWRSISSRLSGDRNSTNSWRLLSWLRGSNSTRGTDEGGIAAFPIPMVVDWIDEDFVDRAPVIAENCPPTISQPGEVPTLARVLLEQYGASEQVRGCLHASTFTGTWWGPASEHYRQSLATLEAQLAIETDANVRLWLRERKTQLEQNIERELERERPEDE